MNIPGVILLFCSIVTFALAAYVIFRRHTRPAHFAFFAVLLSLAVWNSINFLITISSDQSLVEPLGRLSFASGSLIAVFYLVFTWYFPERHPQKPSPRVIVLVTILAATFFFLSCTSLIQAGVVNDPLGKKPVFGLLHPLYAVYMVSLFFWSNYNLVRRRLKTRVGFERMQLNYCLMGFVAAFTFVTLAQFILPFFVLSNDYALIGGGVSSLSIALMTSYAILRYRLMGMGIAVRNLTIVGIMAAIISLFVALPLLLYPHLFEAVGTGFRIFTSLILALLLAVIIAPLYRVVTEFVDVRIFRGRYDHQGALVRLGQRLAGTYGRERLAHAIAAELPVILQADGSSVYLLDESRPGYRCCAYVGLDRPEPSRLDKDAAIVKAVIERHSATIKEEVGFGPHLSRYDTAEVQNLFESLHAELGIPLESKGRVFGLLFLGARRNGNIFTSDELKLLNSLVSQAAVALDNTWLYGQVLEAQKHYATILKHMQRGVLTVDLQLHAMMLNNTGAAILGMKGDDLLGSRVDVLFPEFGELLRKTLECRIDQDSAEVMLTVKSATVPCECETSVLLDGRNRPMGALLVFQDLTERKKFDVQVRRMERLASVGTLAAGMAHEIKNPLVAIQTFAQLLPERYEDAAFRHNFTDVVTSEVRRINQLVQNLLHFARPRQQKPGFVSISDTMQRTLALLENHLEKAGVEVYRDYPDDMPEIFADPEQLHQVFLNLFQNAIDAMTGEVRKLQIVASVSDHGRLREKRKLELLIKDTGTGISQEDMTRIFDPFFSTKSNGSGLGLAICHGIVKEHGGVIEVDSVSGEGTTFKVIFPIAEKPRELSLAAERSV